MWHGMNFCVCNFHINSVLDFICDATAAIETNFPCVRTLSSNYTCWRGHAANSVFNLLINKNGNISLIFIDLKRDRAVRRTLIIVTSQRNIKIYRVFRAHADWTLIFTVGNSNERVAPIFEKNAAARHHAIVQVVIRWLPTAAARVQTRV
jgi:hypothetical protein